MVIYYLCILLIALVCITTNSRIRQPRACCSARKNGKTCRNKGCVSASSKRRQRVTNQSIPAGRFALSASVISDNVKKGGT